MSNVSRSVYQKVCEENKKLLADIKLLSSDELSGEKILCAIRWRKKFAEDKEFNNLIGAACKEYIKEHPQYYIKPISEEGKRQAIINANNLPIGQPAIPIQLCTAKNCKEVSVGDYNGHGAFACEYHMKKWDDEFEEDYK